MADAEEQLAGTRAQGDGPCVHPDCETGQFLKDERITRHKDGWMHVTHAPGWDDEGGRTRKPPRKRKAAKKSPAGGTPATVEAVEASDPPAGDAPEFTVTDPTPYVETVRKYAADLAAVGATVIEHGGETYAFDTPPPITLTRPMTPDEADEWWKQTTPGLVYGMPNDVYHRDPWIDGSVSNSDAQLLLDAPALYRYAKDNPRTFGSRQMNLGSAAHTKVLGEGGEFVNIYAENYRTNAAKQARDDALAAGKIPLLPHEWATVDAMAKVLEQDPLAPQLFARGRAEVSAFWLCPETGVPRRARFDWLPDVVPGQRMIVPDFKSTEQSVSPGAFAKSAIAFSYDMQDATYSSALAALGIDNDAAFVFCVQSVKPPYLVAVHQLNEEARAFGHQRSLRALRRWQYATETGDWFGYAGVVHDVSLPGWSYQAEEFEAARDARLYLRSGWGRTT
jgi:hypothetical protein